MGRDGGGRGTGGPHRTPSGGRGGAAGRGRGGGEEGTGDGGRGGRGGAFSAFQAQRNAALERDLDNARKRTAEAAGTGASVGGFGAGRGPGSGPGRGPGRGQQPPPVRVHHQSNHPPHGKEQGGVGQQQGQQQQGTYHRPNRAPHRGGPPKANFAETVLRPASEGHPNPNAPSKYTSGIPKLTARKRLGQQVHDEEQLVSARPAGQRLSGRAAVRGEMSNRVMGDLENQGESGDSSPPSGVSGLQAMMMRKSQQQGGGAMIARPIRERATPIQNRQRSLQFLRGRDDDDDDKKDDDQDEEKRNIMKLADDMQAEHLEDSLINHFSKSDNQDGDGYDSDADLESPIKPGDPNFMDLDNHEHVRKNEEGDYIYDWEAMDRVAIQEIKKEGWDAEEPRRFGNNQDEDVDPVTQTFEWQYYFRDVTDTDNPLLLKPSKPDSDAMLPLKPHGPELDDFLFAVMNHPSKYAVIERKVKHADSKREPRPIFPKDRKLPEEEFVKKYKGFLFVSGLVPHLESSGEVKDFDDVLHKQSISEDVAKLFGVKSLDVWPATTTSAFVGFGTKLEAKAAMIDSTNDDRLQVSHPVELQKYESKEEESMTDEEKEFVAASPDGPASILKVTGLPANATSVELLQSMFPLGSRLEAMFGPLSKDDYCRVSSTSALINLASADLVSKALKSTNIANNASVVGRKRSVQVLRAKCERVFDGWQGGTRKFAASKLGNRLVVTGDVPPNEMYLSHNDTLHISGLSPNVTLDDIALFFQPFSSDRRDVYGSGHIVRCSQGLPTGSAYVGFEMPGEMDQVKELYKDLKATIGGAEVTFRPVRDKMLRRGVREGARPTRSVEELRSDLYDWERHVDPKDIQELADLGIEKGVLDEAMITLRHHNRTFAAGDQAISGERLYQERQTGMHYRDVVRKYLKVLKGCVGTREDPGLMYWAMFAPDQEMDMGLFDIEEERISELRKKGI